MVLAVPPVMVARRSCAHHRPGRRARQRDSNSMSRTQRGKPAGLGRPGQARTGVLWLDVATWFTGQSRGPRAELAQAARPRLASLALGRVPDLELRRLACRSWGERLVNRSWGAGAVARRKTAGDPQAASPCAHRLSGRPRLAQWPGHGSPRSSALGGGQTEATKACITDRSAC